MAFTRQEKTFTAGGHASNAVELILHGGPDSLDLNMLGTQAKHTIAVTGTGTARTWGLSVLIGDQYFLVATGIARGKFCVIGPNVARCSDHGIASGAGVPFLSAMGRYAAIKLTFSASSNADSSDTVTVVSESYEPWG